MPSHYWGDEDFDWDSLYKAETEIRNILRLGRIGVHSKEKYGRLRWSLFLCDNTLHSLTHPGYVYNQYPQWMWVFDLKYKPLRIISPLIRMIQKQIVQYAFNSVCGKYPHIKDEIIQDAPVELLPPHLAIDAAKMWASNCKKCGKSSTTDNYICPHCGEEK